MSSAPGGVSPREINGESSLKALWKLIYRAIQTQKFAQNHANSDFARILTSDLQENFEKWRKNLRNNFPINIEKSKRSANELNKCLSNRGLGLQ